MRFILKFAVVLCLCFGATAQTLVFHNTLGSDAECAASVVGPPLSPAVAGGWNTLGTPAFTTGVDGGALTLGPPQGGGGYACGDRIRLYTLPSSLVNPERGTLEATFKMNVAPGSCSSFHYANLYDGPYGEEPGFGLTVADRFYNGTARVVFYLNGTTIGYLPMSLTDGLDGFDITGQVGVWLHFVAMWDRNGIAGTADKIRLYVNDVLRAKYEGPAGWIAGWTYPTMKIGGCTDLGQNAYEIDEMKIWAEALDNVVPTFMLHLGNAAGGGAFVHHLNGAPFDFGLTAFSFDPANAGAGFGNGWMAGLHIGLGELLYQWSVPLPPFICALDAAGASYCVVPADVTSLFSGLTVYAVAIDVVPMTLAVVDVSLPTLLTLP